MKDHSVLSWACGLACAVASLTTARPLQAQSIPASPTGDPAPATTPPPRPSPPQLVYDLRIDLPLALGGYAVWSVLQLMQPQLAATHCRWCDDHLNAVDQGTRSALRWQTASHRATAESLSSLTANLATPILSLGLSGVLAAHDDRFHDVPVDIVLAYEAITAAGILTQAVKYSVGRLRPDARVLPPSERPHSGHGEDAYVSFYSGHTSYAFSVASAAGTIAWMRRYPGARWVWVAGLTAAATTGYLRIAADKHYLTDVLSSALSGTAVGFAIPYLMHRPRASAQAPSLAVLPTAGGLQLGLQGLW